MLNPVPSCRSGATAIDHADDCIMQSPSQARLPKQKSRVPKAAHSRLSRGWESIARHLIIHCVRTATYRVSRFAHTIRNGPKCALGLPSATRPSQSPVRGTSFDHPGLQGIGAAQSAAIWLCGQRQQRVHGRRPGCPRRGPAIRLTWRSSRSGRLSAAKTTI